MTLYYVTNNFNCICEDCLDGFDFDVLYQPAFKAVVDGGTCELCGYTNAVSSDDTPDR